MIKIKKNANPEAYIRKEWLYTNGLGGYASSTIIGMNSRKYHGLLVAALNPPTERRVLVAKVEETVLHGDKSYSLSTNQYPNTFYPKGYQNQIGFDRKPFPMFRYKVDKLSIEKTVFMVQNTNTTLVEYQNTSRDQLKLRLNPLYSDRDFHGLFFENPLYDFYVEKNGKAHVIYPRYGEIPVYFKYSKGDFIDAKYWFKNIEYAIEQYRGMDFAEDACSTGYLDVELEAGENVYLLFTTDKEYLEHDPAKLKKQEEKYIRSIRQKEIKDEFVQDLIYAGDQFIVHRKSTDSASIIAGYHWFSDWARDTMISVLGLCIATDNKKAASSIINTFIAYLDKGMIPNRFPDYADEPPEYNTVDGTLWLFIAIYEYYRKFEEKSFIKKAYPRLAEIIKYHLEGTRYDIHVLESGLLYAGKPDTQLTWMDARIGDYVVTPRNGCPVEVNALWYNALMIFDLLSDELGKKNTITPNLAQQVKKSFRKEFLNDKGYLNDMIYCGAEPDTSIRPNQIYAVSLPFPLLNTRESKSVINHVKKHLLTRYGLRSLSPQSRDFIGTYQGNQWSRDTAYHQGTVWPFLLGEYYLALLKTNNYSKKAKDEVETHILGLKDHFYKDGCIIGISEIFDGDKPKMGKGCSQQAWSVAQLIRVIFTAGLFQND